MNERFALHIDRCLTCRACESVCPNHVRFGQLIDGTRAMMASSSKPLGGSTQTSKSWFRRWVEREIIGKPTRIEALRPLLRFYQRSGMQKLLRKSGLLGKTKLILLETQLPRIDKPYSLPGRPNFAGSWQAVYPTTGQPRGEVGLFLGCVARLTDTATLNATIIVLNRLGYTVHVPHAQTCCGALHQHSGDKQTGAQLAHRNISAFDGLNLKAIISTASGCGVQLAEYSILSPLPGSKEAASELEAGNGYDGDTPPSKRFSAKVMDISAFLAVAEGWDEIKLAPLAHKIAVHEPCSLRNVLRGSAFSYALLARIPNARIAPLTGNDQCCGAAGTYFLDQPEMAKVLLHAKISALNASGARYLATSNVGCAMHLASALREGGSEIEVLHPVTLIARQMNINSEI
jgi:glycolate oxidase iron-sulfur subunit